MVRKDVNNVSVSMPKSSLTNSQFTALPNYNLNTMFSLVKLYALCVMRENMYVCVAKHTAK